jgi:hypothetical protein
MPGRKRTFVSQPGRFRPRRRISDAEWRRILARCVALGIITQQESAKTFNTAGPETEPRF